MAWMARTKRSGLGVLALVVGLLIPLGELPASAAASWRTLASVERQISGSFAVSCSSASTCAAVAATSPPSIATTEDAGVTWTTGYTTTALDLNAISCPSDSACFAVGRPKSWSQSCTSPGQCSWTGPPEVVASTDGGATWALQADSAKAPFLPWAIDCATELACSVAGTTWEGDPNGGATSAAVMTTTNGGATWQLQQLSLSPALTFLDSVDCPSAGSCIASGWDEAGAGRYLTTSDGWATYDAPRKPKAGGLAGVACPTELHCVMSSNASRQVNPFVSVAIPRVYLSDDGGSTWHLGSSFPADHSIWTMSCSSESDCVALVQPPSPNWAQGSYAKPTLATSSDGGEHFSGTGHGITGDAPTGSFRCSSASSCVMAVITVAGSPAPAFTTDTGASWTTRPLPEGPFSQVTASTCPTDQRCLVFGRTASGTLNFAASGSNRLATVPLDGSAPSVASFPGSYPVEGVDCPSPSACFAVTGGQLLRSADQGGTWTSRRLPRGLLGKALSCSAVDRCTVFAARSGSFPMPVGFIATANGGLTWSQPTQPSSLVSKVSSLSCPSAKVCTAVATSYVGGEHDVVLRSGDGARSWTLARLPRSKMGFGQLECASESLCLLVRNYSRGNPDASAPAILRSTDQGRSFKVLSSVPEAAVSNRDPRWVSCAGPLSCLLDGLFATTDGGSTWAAEDGGPATLAALSCPTVATCFGIVNRDEGGWRLLARG